MLICSLIALASFWTTSKSSLGIEDVKDGNQETWTSRPVPPYFSEAGETTNRIPFGRSHLVCVGVLRLSKSIIYVEDALLGCLIAVSFFSPTSPWIQRFVLAGTAPQLENV